MPVYDYKCLSCGQTYDVYHKSREIIEDIVCPSCSSGKHKRLISAPAVSVKSGFYSGPSSDSGPCCGGGCGID